MVNLDRRTNSPLFTHRHILSFMLYSKLTKRDGFLRPPLSRSTRMQKKQVQNVAAIRVSENSKYLHKLLVNQHYHKWSTNYTGICCFAKKCHRSKNETPIPPKATNLLANCCLREPKDDLLHNALKLFPMTNMINQIQNMTKS